MLSEVFSESLLSSSDPPCLYIVASTDTGQSHAGCTQSHAGSVAHAGQGLNSLGEVVGEDSSILSTAPTATHPGQGGAAHGVVDGLLSENTQTAFSIHSRSIIIPPTQQSSCHI